VGIGQSDPAVNPLVRAPMSTLRRCLGGEIPTLDSPTLSGPGGRSFPIDACMGVPGLPQSGTGQVSLLTGHNAPALLGRHFGPWPPVRLRPLLAEQNLFRTGAERGKSIIFANAYPKGFPDSHPTRRIAAPPLAAHSAGLLVRHEEHLRSGDAIASEIVNDRWRASPRGRDLRQVTPKLAGRNLARLANAADLTFFAHYQTDIVGHREDMKGAVAALTRVDEFLAGLLAAQDDDTLTLLVSDHGNIEELGTGHTRNPALGVAIGPGALDLELPTALSDVTPFILEVLDITGRRSGPSGNAR
jgi:2,3-bisphosphoglycerate-independent phosphoglycerate mutase